jgi:hypothetical protein
MPSTRTQIYLTTQQRRLLDALRRARGLSLAALIRDAIDAYLAAPERTDLGPHFERTAGSIPDLTVPSRAEWERVAR